MSLNPKQNIWATLKELKIPFEVEYQFLPDRKFRADWAIPSKMILIEYEGIFSAKSRHTSVTGYSGDLNKYNLATLNGWKILRYSAINYRNFYTDIKLLLSLQCNSR